MLWGGFQPEPPARSWVKGWFGEAGKWEGRRHSRKRSCRLVRCGVSSRNPWKARLTVAARAVACLAVDGRKRCSSLPSATIRVVSNRHRVGRGRLTGLAREERDGPEPRALQRRRDPENPRIWSRRFGLPARFLIGLTLRSAVPAAMRRNLEYARPCSLSQPILVTVPESHPQPWKTHLLCVFEPVKTRFEELFHKPGSRTSRPALIADKEVCSGHLGCVECC